MQLSGMTIDSLEFARSEREMSGSVPLASLERLADMLADQNGELAWSVRGELVDGADGERQACLVIEVSGEVRLICQRCLLALPFPLAIENRLLPVPPGKPWPEEALDEMLASTFDPIEALAEQPLLDLVEDEVLLALPLAPRHASCGTPKHDDGRAAASPFAQLAQLKKKH